jgi:hypothetical protein
VGMGNGESKLVDLLKPWSVGPWVLNLPPKQYLLTINYQLKENDFKFLCLLYFTIWFGWRLRIAFMNKIIIIYISFRTKWVVCSSFGCAWAGHGRHFPSGPIWPGKRAVSEPIALDKQQHMLTGLFY